MHVGEARRDDRAGVGVLHLALVEVLHQLLVRTPALIAADLGEVRGELPVLVLGPALEGVVVALVAVEADAQEQLGRVLHREVRLALDAPEGGGRVVEGRAAGAEQVADELVVGPVARDLAPQPEAPGARALRADELGADLQEVRPAVGPVLDELRAAEQPPDELVALDVCLALVEEERLDRLRRGQSSRQVERHPPQELRVGAQAAGARAHGLELVVDELVDVAVLGAALPGPAVAVAHDEHARGGVGALVADEHGGLSSPNCGHDPALVDDGDLGVVRLEEGLAGHVTRAPVGQVGDHTHLLGRARVGEGGAGGEDLDPVDAGCLGLEVRAASDPGAQHRVVARAQLEELPALVRHLAGGLLQEEALLGHDAVEASAAEVVGQGEEVVRGVIAAQAQAEAVLAVDVAVARAGVAAGA